ERRQVMGMDVGDRERDGAAVDLRVARAVDDDAGDLLEFLQRVVDQRPLMRPNLVHPEILEIVDRRAQADSLGHARRPGFELPWKVVPAGLVELDPLDHVAPTEKRRHRLSRRWVRPEHADAGWAAHLVAAERRAVHGEVFYVDWPLRDGWRG